MSSLLAHPAPLKWVTLNSSTVVSLWRYPDGDAGGVSGLNCTIPNGNTGPVPGGAGGSTVP